ncbi:D-serine deaminase, pyridoxal phosphate-dependent [Halorientalis persicus]|uniref:D-serine deaminase, pyridoxal phosphate-dependent n=2 Tax=Halorientalis persicus TaxID=1367881 RepID=A0A1H8N9L9_9EURY|nr:D-serine deaminase, pyridoxal phosphate-dependent [Halorientalis persicus]
MGAEMREYDYYRQVFSDRELPLAFVDRDALDGNIEQVRSRAESLPVRIASKSLRCRSVMEYVLGHDGFRGVMCYHGAEAAHLAAHGFDDLLVAYPVYQPSELRTVCGAVDSGSTITLMVDSAAHVERAGEIAAEVGVEVPLCLDVDMSSEHLGVFFGTRRSDVRTPADALAVADAIERTDGVRLDGVMGYEGQIAGLPDRSPANNAAVDAVVRLLKERSKRAIADRRGAVVDALADHGHDLRFVNGGGTGSLAFTTDDPAVTEVTVGSGFYAPTLFDHYDGFQHTPAAGYAIEVTRRPTGGVYTCRGGGYVASGPAGPDKTPTVARPRDAQLTDTEGAGEVQTPIEYDGSLALGDPVVCRHAKAGELCRNFASLAVVADGAVVETAPTYRGDGKCFM